MPASRRGRTRPTTTCSTRPSARRRIDVLPDIGRTEEQADNDQQSESQEQELPTQQPVQTTSDSSQAEVHDSFLTMIQDEFQALRQLIAAPPLPTTDHGKQADTHQNLPIRTQTATTTPGTSTAMTPAILPTTVPQSSGLNQGRSWARAYQILCPGIKNILIEKLV